MMGERRRLRRAGVVAIATAALLTAIPTAPAQAYHRARQAELRRLIEQRRAAIARAEAREMDLTALIIASDRRREALERRLDAVTGRLRASQEELALATARLDRATADLALADALLEQTLADLEHKQATLDERAATLYMLTPAPIVGAFRAARSFRDVLDAEMFATTVVRRDADVAIEVGEAVKRAEEQRAAVERTRDTLAAERAVIARETAAIEAAQREEAAAKGAVDREIANKQRLLADVRDEIEENERAIASYERESSSIASFLRGRQRGQGVIQGQGGYLKWPISGRITSPFGYRTHPISGRRSFHAGIDIAAPHGRTIGAARAGEVVYVGWRGAYGLIVVIDHGKSLATLYAHTSRTYVRVGQVVGTGTAIAAIGSTGYSTGPHVHFEVRVNGEPTNPMSWL